MIKIEDVHVVGLEPAIRGMRNPLASHAKSDSTACMWDCVGGCKGCDRMPDGVDRYHTDEPPCDQDSTGFVLGPNDLGLAKKLAKNGPVHAKYRRMIVVYADITAPLYWWKEASTYKVGTVANSYSTMHKIHSRDLTLDDFSYEHLTEKAMMNLLGTIDLINEERKIYVETKDKKAWYNMIQMLPTNYNQKRTWMANYEVLAGIYPNRKDHKLEEWHQFCDWIKTLPYSELITGEEE